MGPGGHTCLDIADLNVLPDVAARDTGRPVIAPTVCLSKPTPSFLSPCFGPHLSPGSTSSTAHACPPILSHSLQSTTLAVHQDDLLSSGTFIQAATLPHRAMSDSFWGCQALLLPPNPLHSLTLLRTSSLPAALRYLPPVQNKAHILLRPVSTPQTVPLPGILICFLIIMTTVY